jgi:hypothetical protein
MLKRMDCYILKLYSAGDDVPYILGIFGSKESLEEFKAKKVERLKRDFFDKDMFDAYYTFVTSKGDYYE